MSSPASGTRGSADAKRVLIVDDHTDSAELLGLLLEQAGCEIRIAGNSRDARATALEFLPQVALLDIGLPDADGYQLVATLRAEPALRECRFVAVTGYSIEEVERLSVAAAFDGYLSKPIDFAAARLVVLGGASGRASSSTP